MILENTVLIVDDEESIHDLYKEFFKELGYEVFHAYDASEATKIIQEKKPEIVLLDLVLPSGSGYIICKGIKNNEETKDIKVIMLTGMVNQQYKISSLAAGADDFIQKPSSFSYLERAINKLKRKENK